MIQPLRQLYNEQGQPLAGKGANKDEVLREALLHGASHIWMWRKQGATLDVLLQKRAANKRTWPGLYDKSAAGHIDLGEDPLAAAIREIQEEIGHVAQPSDLIFIGTHYCIRPISKGVTENEFLFIYLLEITAELPFTLAEDEVELLEWKSLADLRQLLADPRAVSTFVPHPHLYYQYVFDLIEQTAKKKNKRSEEG